MKPTATQNEVMVMRFEHTYGKYQSGAITCEGAAEILGISLSTFYRMRQNMMHKELKVLLIKE